MGSDLVERLRALGEEDFYQSPYTTFVVVNEAADALSALLVAGEPFVAIVEAHGNDPHLANIRVPMADLRRLAQAVAKVR